MDSGVDDLQLLMEDEGSQNLPKTEAEYEAKFYMPMNKEGFDFLRSQTLMIRKNHKEEDSFIMKRAEDDEI